MPSANHNGAHPALDGPSCCEGLSRSADIDVQLTAQGTMTTADLQTEWQRLYRSMPPIRMSRDLLLRGVAYKIQEQAHGGLSLSIKRKLQSLAGTADRRSTVAAPVIALRPGTKLVREWHGHVYTVSVRENGFEYQGEHYRSLSRIARQITGVRWSGPLFFGIGKRRGGGPGE